MLGAWSSSKERFIGTIEGVTARSEETDSAIWAKRWSAATLRDELYVPSSCVQKGPNPSEKVV